MLSTLIITLQGSPADLGFLRERAVGAIEDLIAEYTQNLDDAIDVSCQWGDE